MGRSRPPHLIMKYNSRGKEAKDELSKDFSTVNGTGTGHVAWKPPYYMTMMLIIIT
jgi:hypothetical protein